MKSLNSYLTIKFLLLCILISTSFYSCKDTLVEDFAPTVRVESTNLAQSILYEGHNGVLQIRHDEGPVIDLSGTQSESFFIRVGGDQSSIYRSPSQLIFSDNWSINLESGITVNRDESDIENIFGSELTFKIEKEIDEKSIIPDIYVGRIPDKLITNVRQIPSYLTEGSNLTWNSDSNNEGGVYIMIDYSPALNEGDVVNNHPVGCIDYIHVPDLGNYNFDLSDFACIPAGALVSVNLIRGAAVEIIDDNTGTDVVVAYSTSGNLFHVQ